MQSHLPHAQSPTKSGKYVDRMRLLRYGECGKQLLYCGSIARLATFVKCFFEKNSIIFKSLTSCKKTFFVFAPEILDFERTI